MKRTLIDPDTGEVWEFEVKSPYAKCEQCGNPYLTFGSPCDHIDRRPGSGMPAWCDNSAEWQMIRNRYNGITGRFGRVSNGDGTYRCERLA